MPTPLLLANVAVPSIQFHLPAMVVLLVPIIVVETIVVRCRLGGGLQETCLHVTMANAASTLVGIPVAWMVMLGVELAADAAGVRPGIQTPLALLGTAMVNATTGGSGPRGLGMALALASTIIMLVPYLLASILIERRVLRRRLPDVEPARIGAAVRAANYLTYGAMAAFLHVELWATVA